MKRPLTQRLKRAFRELVGDGSGTPRGAQSHRLLADWALTRPSINQELRRSIRKMRVRARDLEREDSYVKHFLNLLTVNVLGHRGITLQGKVRSSTGELDRVANQLLETAWRGWAKTRVTTDGRTRLKLLEVLLLRTLARDGEVFIRKVRGYRENRYRFALQPIDPDLVDETLNLPSTRQSNEIRMGVEVDGAGRPVAYHVWDRHDDETGFAQRTRYRVPAEEMLHIFLPERIGQTRGMTWFDSVMVPAHHLEGYEEAEVVAARMGASKMAFFYKEGDGPGAWSGTDGADGGPQRPVTMDFNPGSSEILPDGYRVQAFDPQHPTQAFAPFVKAMLRKIASGLSVSYNALANDLEGVNYSSMRSGLLIEREVWKALQAFWISEFEEEVYPEFLEMAVLSGQLAVPSRDMERLLAVSWRPRGWQWVDPSKDVTASEKSIQLGMNSRTRILAEQGEDFEEILQEIAREEELARDLGVRISAAPQTNPTPNDDEDDDEDDEEE